MILRLHGSFRLITYREKDCILDPQSLLAHYNYAQIVGILFIRIDRTVIANAQGHSRLFFQVPLYAFCLSLSGFSRWQHRNNPNTRDQCKRYK